MSYHVRREDISGIFVNKRMCLSQMPYGQRAIPLCSFSILSVLRKCVGLIIKLEIK